MDKSGALYEKVPMEGCYAKRRRVVESMGEGLGVLGWLPLVIILALGLIACDRVKQVKERVIGAGELLLGRDGEEKRKAAEARSKEEAVKRYPALGVLDSPFNKNFRERVDVLKRTQPSFFERSDWPERLAEEIALTGGRGGMGTESRRAAGDRVLEVNELRQHSERHVGKHRTVQGVILKIHEIDVVAEVIRFQLVGDLEIQMSHREFPAIRDVDAEFLKGRLRVEGGRLMVKGQEGATKGSAVYFPKDATLLSEGASVQVSGNVVVRRNRVVLEKAQLRSVGGGI